MKRVLLYLMAVFCLVVVASTAVAQKATNDPRPDRGAVDRSRMKPYIPGQTTFRGQLNGAKISALAQQAGISRTTRVNLRALRQIAEAPSLRAQTLGSIRIKRAANGTIRWMNGDLGRPTTLAAAGKQSTASQFTSGAIEVLQPFAGVLGIQRPSEELVPRDVNHDVIGTAHARFQQVYRQVPIWGRELLVHFTPDGTVYAVNGNYEPTPVGANTVPRITADAAEMVVVGDLKAAGRWAPLADQAARMLDLGGMTRELVLFPDPKHGMRLSYEVSLHPNLLEWFTYLVDAETGEVLNRFSRHCTLYHRDSPEPVVKPPSFKEESLSLAGGTFMDATGIDLNGKSHAIRVFRSNTGTYYSLYDLGNFDLAKSNLPDQMYGGAMLLDVRSKDLKEETDIFHVTSTDNKWNDKTGVSAQVNQKLAYDYYTSTFQRKAIDNLDQSMISIIHVTEEGKGMDNAFWNGRVMAYGDGDVDFSPLAGALDVAGHEITHGVIQHSANLIYQFQPGALNESFADVFGFFVDHEDFLIGEDITISPGKSALRDLLNPSSANILSPQPAHMKDYLNLTASQDNGGVHINSGIPNRAAALIIQGIGVEKAQRIYYRALTSYLTRNSEFVDARNAVIQSAQDFKTENKYGITDADILVIQQAFDAVGITEGSGDPSGDDNEVPPVQGGQSVIAFMTEEGSIGYLDIENLTGTIFTDPKATARVSTAEGDYAQLSTPLTGKNIYFINTEGKLAVVNVETGEVSVFDDLYLNEEGDLWNASVAPDESFVTLVSSSRDDPTLYFYDGENLYFMELKPEGTQEGIKVETIHYPDVVSWSPNVTEPRIAFDAYNEMGTGLQRMSFWGIYEINFSIEKIYTLLGAQPDNISVGNITYSNTNPDVFAYNVIDYTNESWDVVYGNYEEGELKALGINGYTIDDVPITDAQRPTFSPDDSKLAFTSPSLKALLVYDLEPQQLSYIRFDTPVALYNPRWFMIGGTAVAAEDEVQIPTRVALKGNYPNPFRSSTTLQFDLPAADEVKLEVFDILGRRVAILVDGYKPAGSHHVLFDGKGLSPGIYFARLQFGGKVQTSRMTLLR